MNGQFDITGKVDYNGGTQTNGVSVDMAKERDYAKEWELEQKRGIKLVGVKLAEQIKSDFEERCKQNNTTKNAVLKSYIMRYTYENFDQ